MKTKEIYVEVKKSRNFQTYTAGELLVIEEGDDIAEVRAEGMMRCRAAVLAEITMDNR